MKQFSLSLFLLTCMISYNALSMYESALGIAVLEQVRYGIENHSAYSYAMQLLSNPITHHHSIATISALAKKKYPPAQCALGILTICNNPPEAIDLIYSAACNNYPPALGILGFYAQHGLFGVSQNNAQAKQFYTHALACASGFYNDTTSMHQLGNLLLPEHNQSAYFLLDKAARSGHIESAYQLGTTWLKSKSTKRYKNSLYYLSIVAASTNNADPLVDYARNWIIYLANNSVIEAQCFLIQAHALGIFGFEQSIEKVLTWLQEALFIIKDSNDQEVFSYFLHSPAFKSCTMIAELNSHIAYLCGIFYVVAWHKGYGDYHKIALHYLKLAGPIHKEAQEILARIELH